MHFILYICAYIDTQQNAFVTHDILHEMYKYLYLNNQQQKKNICTEEEKEREAIKGEHVI